MKRLLAAFFGISIIAALLGSAGPASAADSTIRGSVSNGNTTVSGGTVYYYATCDDYRAFNAAATSGITSGQYMVTVPDGSYRVRIEPSAGYAAVDSWHSGKATCEQADLVTVSGGGTRNLVARPGFNVSGTISSANGSVASGDLAFYSSCRAFRDRNSAANVHFSSGAYMITVAAGTYYARISPENGRGAITSWHDAQPTCATAAAITINSNTVGKTLHAVPGVNLSGTIRTSRGPIGSAILQFYASCEDYQDNNLTGSVYPSSGTYAITLPAGSYRVKVSFFGTSDGALESWHNAAATCADSTAISVSGASDTEPLTARAAAIVTGSVSRAGGGTITGGRVSFYESCQDYEWAQEAGGGYIEPDGQYSALVPPGTYLVLIYPEGRDGALTSWHNGVRSCAQATAVTVSGDSTRNLVAAPGYVVTGSVTSATGPVPEGAVAFYADCDDSVVGAVNIDAGSYTISLPPGTYRVRIQPGDSASALTSWHHARATCETADTVTVSGSGRIDLVATAGARVTGQPASANGPIEYGMVSFFATCEDYTAEEPVATAWINGGVYVTALPHGNYRVLVEPSIPSDAVLSWHNAEAKCEQAAVVTVARDMTLDPVAVTGTHVTGTVSSSNGPMASGWLTFFDSCQAYEDWESKGYAEVLDGQYSVWLPPGTYHVFIDPNADATARSWHNAKNSCAGSDMITVTGLAMTQGIVAAAGVDVAGLVTKGGTAIPFGSVTFYATCQDFLAGQEVSQTPIQDGVYATTLAPGSYRALITAMGRNGEKFSWHSATGNCGSATPVVVSGSTTAHLQARTTSTISGGVSGPSGLLDWGYVEFFATCQDYLDGNPAAYAPFTAGAYSAGLPNGSFLARVHPYSGAAPSWHNAATGCGSATAITVSGSGTHDLVAARGAVVTGTVTSSAGPVKSAGVQFYADCRAYYRSDEAGTGHTTKGMYTVNVVPGTYRVLVNPGKGTGARESWHAAKATCESADLVTVTGDSRLDLIALAKYAQIGPVPPNPPGPPSLSAQSVKKPPKNMKKGKKVALAKRTKQGVKLTWKSRTKKVCTVKKTVLTAKRKGKCKISASAPATSTFKPFAKRYTIRVR
jgi:hypothetical protein